MRIVECLSADCMTALLEEQAECIRILEILDK